MKSENDYQREGLIHLREHTLPSGAEGAWIRDAIDALIAAEFDPEPAQSSRVAHPPE
jgi:hypothetical protein